MDYSLNKWEHLDTLFHILPNMNYEILNDVIKEYSFYSIQDLFDQDQEIDINCKIKHSKCIILYQHTNFIFISIRKTLIAVDQISNLENILIINDNLPIYCISDCKIHFNNSEKIQNRMKECNQIFLDEIYNFSSYLNIDPKVNSKIIKLWNIIRRCIAGYLIK